MWKSVLNHFHQGFSFLISVDFVLIKAVVTKTEIFGILFSTSTTFVFSSALFTKLLISDALYQFFLLRTAAVAFLIILSIGKISSAPF